MKWMMCCAMLALAGCGTFPAELEVANAKQRQAAEAIEADYQALVDASTAEIERMGMLILDAEVERKWQAETNPEGLLPLTKAKEIAAWAASQRDTIVATRESKRKALRDSTNLEILKDMNQALRDYLVSVGGSIREIERLIGGNP